MPAGFESVNDRGVLQITDAQQQYVLVKSGYLTQGDFFGNGVQGKCFARIDVPNPVQPIIAIRSLTNSSRATSIQYSAGLFNVCKWWNLTVDVPIEYFIFDLRRPPGSNFGMQLFDGAGNLSFDANWHLLSIVEARTLSYANMPASNVEQYQDVYLSRNYAEKIAVIMAMPGCLLLNGLNATGFECRTCCWLPNQSMIRVAWVLTFYDSSGGGRSGWFNRGGMQMMVIDTTFLPIPYQL